MIDIIFLDVDGCMSDGGLYHSNSGEEMKKFNVKDGFAIEQWSKMGKIVAIITGKKSQIVEKRGAELSIKYVFQGVKDKLEVAKEILKKEGLELSNAAAIGDDYNDMKLLNAVALSFKPANAMPLVQADITLSKNGGDGAVREMIEMIIDKNDMREIWMQKWL
ncbi:KdsC family phosphatase [Campylobacter geochelonis]|uniref:3-deoxy-D-manno-octulosonate 8-phosphate phosphatase (KDO 8-P phosphatase) n=1 Tax=Campylobacter geochelonis TaxID=1780362 RepID=A0A128EKW2_9BACT|nr:HAD-IIIA family hydrolase [Campylobacter geochelonis]QKF71677.1 3-deoxy-D-manno-octulosonate 8-phosphate phosphatase, YrbI family [Campylobacter geochelonis]CZE49257.1 3-deoxy-D-manno-octulosonate 8-phosphate phosphatase (KDO 8-P phosphatase) [Campylobacter geochelonis]